MDLSNQKDAITDEIKGVERDIKIMVREFGDNGPDPALGRKSGQAFNIWRKERKKSALQKDTSVLGGQIRLYQDSIQMEDEK